SYNDFFTARSLENVFYMQEGRSDNAYSRVENYHHQRLANGNFNSNTPAFLYYYELEMKHLGRLNTFIANTDVPYVEDEAVRTKYKSILEALRIWHYFKLTFHYGDLPFHLEPADVAEATQPSTPKEEILNTLSPMAEEIAERLSPDEYTSDKYRFNRYSLKALTMRYALYNNRYELAAKSAKEIIESGKYQLHPTYGDLFQYKAASNNNEFI